MKLGVITTSYPRTPGDPAGSFVAAHVEALRALGHEVEVIAAGTPGPRASDASSSDSASSGSASSGSASSGSRARAASTAPSSASPSSGSRAHAASTWPSSASPSSGSPQPGSSSSHPGSAARPPVPVTWVASSLFAHGGAPDHLERHPVRTLAAAALIAARMTLVVARRAQRWDSIIAHWLVPSAIAALPSGRPLLAIAHGGDIHTLRRMKLLAPVLDLLYRRDARLAFVSEPLRAIARDAAPRLAAWIDTATVQPMGLDLARFSRVGHTPTQPPTIVIAARLVDIKGVDVAIDALAHLRAPVRLVIAGDGPARAALEARGRDPAHAVEFLGEVDTVRRDRLLREASVVVVPSRVTPSGRTEGMPMIALEALAAGVPVVASAVGGLSGLAPAAMLVRPDRPRELAAAIDQTLSEPPDAQRLRAAVAHLGWENVVTRLVRNP